MEQPHLIRNTIHLYNLPRLELLLHLLLNTHQHRQQLQQQQSITMKGTQLVYSLQLSRRRAKRGFSHIHGGGDHNLNDNDDDDCNKSKNNSNNNTPQQSPPSSSSPTNHQAMHAEMTARLAEGTLRAYRDLALDEASELHSALHHWTIRWERPL